MLKSILVGAYALVIGARHFRTCGIRWGEAGRFATKLFSLGMLYAAFVKPEGTVRRCTAAARAAFLCCAYDVVTDWRSFAVEYRMPFEKVLRRLVPEWAVRLTMRLYWADCHEVLRDDGLERGCVAVRFIVGVVGSEAHFAQFGIDRLGRVLQIVDDILDVESDSRFGELNCLNTPRAAEHIKYLRANLEATLELFRTDIMMSSVIARAARKAASILEQRS